MQRKYESSPLLIRPTFFEGIARIFDFTGALNRHMTSASSEDADTRAIAADWLAVGDDFLTVFQGYGVEHGQR